MQCSWSEVWVTALIPSNYSSTLLEQKKKKKWRRHFGNIPCDRERELLIREDQGCSVATSLVSWSLSKDRFWTLSNETGWLFCGTGLMGQHPQSLTPFCCNLEPEFSQGQVQSTHSLAAHYSSRSTGLHDYFLCCFDMGGEAWRTAVHGHTWHHGHDWAIGLTLWNRITLTLIFKKSFIFHLYCIICFLS